MADTQPTLPKKSEQLEGLELSLVDTQVSTTVQKTGDFLGGIFQEELNVKNEKIKQLMEDFKEVVKEKENETDYDYRDYEDRLCMRDEDFERGLNELISSDTEIGRLYKLVIGEYDGKIAKELVRKRLKDNYLEDLVYENTEDFTVDISKHLISINYDFCRTDKESLEEVFKNSTGFKSLSLMNTKFRKPDKEKLQRIFKNFKQLKGLNLENSDLYELDKDNLEVIFKNLKGLKSLNLEGNHLCKLDNERLKVILKNLGGLKILKLHGNKLREEQKELIRETLPNTKITF